MVENSLSQIRLTAAALLAAAVGDYAPQTLKIRGGKTSWGFYYDFIFLAPISEEMLPFLEERMRQIASQNLEIKIHEMIPSNAADYLLHHRHPYAAHFVKKLSIPLIQILQMGEFVDPIHGECLSHSGELEAFKLLGIEERPDLNFRGDKKKVMRIYGTAFPKKEALKAFMREKKRWLENHHLIWGEKLELFMLELSRSPDHFEKVEIFWTRAGEKVLHHFKQLWRKIFIKEGFELIQTSGKDLTASHLKFFALREKSEEPLCIAEMRAPLVGGEISPLEGFFTAQHTHRDRAHIFCSKKHLREKMISSLKFLEKIPRMFQLNYEVLASSSEEWKVLFEEELGVKVQTSREIKVEWLIKEGECELRKGPYLTVKEWGKGYLIELSAFFSLERMLAHILEIQEKDLSQKKEILSKIESLDE